MADEQNSKNTPYRDERNTEPSRDTGDITGRNNNVVVSTPGASEPNVEGANDAGISDSAVDDRKLTNFTSNHSADA